jgi:hypothetical protein
LLGNIVHLTLSSMGILLVKSYEVYCRILDRIRFALVIKISGNQNVGMYY